MLRTLDIEASPVAEPLLDALDILRSHGTARPTGFLRPNSRWSRLLRTQSDHRLCETAVFRAGDVWLPRSRRYGDIRKALLSTPAGAYADRSLPVPASPHDWLAERRLPSTRACAGWPPRRGPGATAGESIEDSVLRVERTEAAVPPGAADLVADLLPAAARGADREEPPGFAGTVHSPQRQVAAGPAGGVDEFAHATSAGPATCRPTHLSPRLTGCAVVSTSGEPASRRAAGSGR